MTPFQSGVAELLLFPPESSLLQPVSDRAAVKMVTDKKAKDWKNDLHKFDDFSQN